MYSFTEAGDSDDMCYLEELNNFITIGYMLFFKQIALDNAIDP